MSMVKTPDSTILVPASPVHATHSPDSPFSFDTPLSPVLDEFPPIPSTMMHDQMELQVGLGREKENRDSSLSTMTVTPATIFTATVVKSARGNVIVSPTKGNDEGCSASSPTVPPSVEVDDVRSYSPQSAESHSSVSSSSTTMSTSTGTGSASSDSRPQTLTVSEVQDWKIGDPPKSKGFGYIDVSPEPSPRSTSFADRDVFTVRPSIVISEIISPGNPDVSGKLLTPLSSTSSSSPSPSSPAPRYPGWVSAVVAPLKEFINDAVDPRDIYADLREIAEGESGSVYAARVISPRTTLSTCVAIKNVPILPSGSPKLVDLRRELTLMRGVQHPHILTMDGVYVDLVEDSLWIRMDLMERSLADIIGLVEEGIMVQEKPIAQFASDVLHALDYLQSLGIAHRDLRSDNLLVNREGVVKIADFSSAVQVSKDQPNRSDPAGVVYWQPPEMRKGSYNALKTDVWSLGATVWELAQGEPPFSDVIDARQMGDQWPSLSQPEIYSRSFHDFLNLCSKPSSSRPDSRELLSTPFIRNASGRSAIINLLSDS
ncbi:Serine/threonine-protein kinase shk1/pak1 [Grifola frondosa]|uniref:Serine/threonine-protein kinase shk1/pak1 n=1 Tax=Grifola frondosa TaxID=5627 RepID=A0A1C7MDP4_GRIFR|nr:Serine/threonine-protein kinase shk1/pak1 [Grifola frondosa]